MASRVLGGSVRFANDEFFADAGNLIEPGPASHDPAAFGIRGKLYDGWETRRRREPGEDFAIVRLAAPAVLRGVNIDTTHFRGNYPPAAVLDGATLLGYPALDEVLAARWTPLTEVAGLAGNQANLVPVTAPDQIVTHVRLRIQPDGGVARLRAFGEIVPDPAARGPGGPGRRAGRRSGDRVQQHVLRRTGQRARPGAGAGHVGRLGDAAAPR